MKKERELNVIEMLKYQLQRYQATGNGSMCQALNAKIRRLMLESNRYATGS